MRLARLEAAAATHFWMFCEDLCFTAGHHVHFGFQAIPGHAQRVRHAFRLSITQSCQVCSTWAGPLIATAWAGIPVPGFDIRWFTLRSRLPDAVEFEAADGLPAMPTNAERIRQPAICWASGSDGALDHSHVDLMFTTPFLPGCVDRVPMPPTSHYVTAHQRHPP